MMTLLPDCWKVFLHSQSVEVDNCSTVYFYFLLESNFKKAVTFHFYLSKSSGLYFYFSENMIQYLYFYSRHVLPATLHANTVPEYSAYTTIKTETNIQGKMLMNLFLSLLSDSSPALHVASELKSVNSWNTKVYTILQTLINTTTTTTNSTITICPRVVPSIICTDIFRTLVWGHRLDRCPTQIW